MIAFNLAAHDTAAADMKQSGGRGEVPVNQAEAGDAVVCGHVSVDAHSAIEHAEGGSVFHSRSAQNSLISDAAFGRCAGGDWGAVFACAGAGTTLRTTGGLAGATGA